MKKFLQKKLKNEKGLTLVELLAVIVILGIIAAIAVPAIGNIIDNSRIKAIKADAQNVLSAANMYFTENPPTGTTDNTITGAKLQTEGFLEDVGSAKDLTVTYKNATKNATEKPNTINGTAKDKDITVTFANATNKEITLSGKNKSVPAPATP